jgi:hypothetical protein
MKGKGHYQKGPHTIRDSEGLPALALLAAW